MTDPFPPGAPGPGPSSAGHFAVAVGRFYEDLAARLLAGVQRAFDEAGASFEVHDVPGAYELPLAALYLAETGRVAGVAEAEVHDVPGAYELPLAALYLAQTGRIDGVACLGAVIRGETTHYDYVCNEAARGIQDVQLRTGVPCAFGVLTVDNMDQAIARTGGGKRDSGEHAAQAVMALSAMRTQLHS